MTTCKISVFGNIGPDYMKYYSDYTKYHSLENSVLITFSRVMQFFCAWMEFTNERIPSASVTSQKTITLNMADQKRFDFYVVFTMIICVLKS